MLICFQFGWMLVLLLGWMIPAMIYLLPHLGVHYPSDVLASFVLAIIVVAITLFIAPYIVEYTNELKKYALYLYVYWTFIIGYAIVGIQLCLKRI